MVPLATGLPSKEMREVDNEIYNSKIGDHTCRASKR